MCDWLEKEFGFMSIFISEFSVCMALLAIKSLVFYMSTKYARECGEIYDADRYRFRMTGFITFKLKWKSKIRSQISGYL